MKKLVPIAILCAAGVAAFLVWKRGQPAATDGSAAVDTGVTSGGFLSDLLTKFGLVAPAAPAPSPAPAPAPATANDNGT